MCPDERVCRCKAEAVAVYTTDDRGCRDCSCKIVSEAAPVVQEEASQGSGAAASGATSAAVPVGITTLVLLVVAAAVLARRRQRRNAKSAEGRAADLTWDESALSGFQAATIATGLEEASTVDQMV